ncbi:Hypothetical predicted protein, partial [Marmota monax]
MARQGKSICLPAWQPLSLAWNKCINSGQGKLAGRAASGRAATASQHQHGASLQTALAQTKRAE